MIGKETGEVRLALVIKVEKFTAKKSKGKKLVVGIGAWKNIICLPFLFN